MTPSRRAAARAVAVGAALVLLLSQARHGAPMAAVMACLVLYVAVAAVWVRSQYVDGLDGEQWVPGRRALLALTVLGGVFAAVYLYRSIREHDPSTRAGLLLVAVLCWYFAGGYALIRARSRTSRRVWLAGVATAAGAVVGAVVGTATLGRAPAWFAGGLLAVSLLLLAPVSVSLLSERLVRDLCARPELASRLTVGGACALTATLGATYVLTRSTWLLVTLIALVFVVAAIVSSTHADLLVVMAVVALLGVTPHQLPRHDRFAPAGGSNVLVAIGDSYMSGEGAASYFENTDDGGGNQCRQAPTAWAALAGQMPPFDRVDFVACSGAKTANLLREGVTVPGVDPELVVGAERQNEDLPTQLDELATRRGTYTPRLVVLSIGGNDAGFSSIGAMCLAPGSCADERGLWTHPQNFEQIRRQLAATYAQVRDLYGTTTPVAVIPYPDPIKPHGGCGELALTAAERDFVREFLVDRTDDRMSLNRVIRETAATYGFHYVAPIERSLRDEHLQLCDEYNGGKPGLNFIGLRSVRGIPEQRFNPKNWLHSSLHPNERGHAAMLRAFAAWHADAELRTPLQMAPEVRFAPATTGAAAGAEPRDLPCDLLRPEARSCRELGGQWAGREVGSMLLTRGWLLAAAVGVSAFVMLCGLAGRRRRYWAEHPPLPTP